MNHNRILKELVLGTFNVKMDIDALRCLVGAIRENSSLQRIQLWIANDVNREDATVIVHREELTHDHRIEYRPP